MGAARNQKQEQAAQPAPVWIRLAGDKGQPIELRPEPKAFQAAAMRWSYVVRNRERWRTGGEDPGQGADGPLHQELAPHLERIANAAIIEVSVPGGADEREGWEYRVFPWEYALAAATHRQRSGRPLLVVRHLRCGNQAASPYVSLDRPATIESSPGELARYYDTRLEGDLMLEALGLLPAAVQERLHDPTSSDAKGWVSRVEPTLLHLAGCDTHQAIDLLGLERQYPARERRDGLALRSADAVWPIEIAEAERLADIVCAGARKPDLVHCNFYNSASRLASRIVAKGARAAIGYHDVIDDTLAVLFSTTLYRQLAQGVSLLEAFRLALTSVRQQELLRGAGIVLWSRVSLLQLPAQKTAPLPRTAKAPETAASVAAHERIEVRASVKPLINYSLLHNGLSPFKELVIGRRNVEGPIRDIQVAVELHAGETAFPYRATFELPSDRDALVLTQDIVFPLTSALIRTQSERIQSSLRLTVHCAGELVKEQTFRVGLAPVDEWQDGEKAEWRWLPSFVLPRDPAVARIIDTAHAILCALADDPAAGFDGYQSVDAGAGDDQARYGCVDKQVQAIWYAILNQHGLTYINPPPSYGLGTQRLRTPSQLLSEKRGTCIDLALLLAACLEYVGIWPVLFLLTGHAFVGYWRSEELHDKFVKVDGLKVDFEEGEPETGARNARANVGGVFGPEQRLDVQRRIHSGHLVPLEATWLTARSGFEAAAEEGQRNVRSVIEYQAMIDLQIARGSGVTPLPLLGAAP